jgi:histidyl-tRNA synthetase
MGLERILLAIGEQDAEEEPLVFVAPLGPEMNLEALALAQELRSAGLQAELDTRGGSLKSLLRRANHLNARFCLVLGKDELALGQVQLKDFTGHHQENVPLDQVVAKIKSGLLQKVQTAEVGE